MARLDDALKKARNTNTGIVSSKVFSIESMRRNIVSAHELQQPIILQIDPNYIDIEDAIFWKDEYAKNYPCADIYIVVQGVKSFEDAIKFGTYAIDGISLSDCLKDEETIKSIYDVMQCASISLERSVSSQEIMIGKIANADIIRINDLVINDENLSLVIENTKELTKDKRVVYAINDFEVSKDNFKIVKNLGISKFDVYETASKQATKKLDNIMYSDYDHNDRFFMINLVQNMLDGYCETIKQRMYYLGQFILR